MRTIFLSPLLIVAFLFSGHSVLAEQLSQILNRQSVSGLRLYGTLSRDIYKSVPYEDYYEEQEPYQVEETYYVDVPYQETEVYYEDVPYEATESYLDTEYYYENEYRCKTVTEHERVCRNERVCKPRPGEQICRMVEECGTNAHGQRICKTRKVCEQGPGREECSNRQVCKNEPRQKQQCGYEKIQKSRTVTKYRTVIRYRQEQRTRTVTKYRQEARTRTVTKYRTVTKCCVTKYRDEFSHKLSLDVRITFPPQAALFENEFEKFRISLQGTESKPDILFEVLDSVFGYKVIRKDVRAGSAHIELGLVAKYNQQNLGANSISKVELTGSDEALSELLIHDAGLKPRVMTQYRFQILQKGSTEALVKGETQSHHATGEVISVSLTKSLPADVDYLVQISATRSGIVLDGPFSFTVNRDVKFQRWHSSDFGPKTIKGLKINEEDPITTVEFIDEGAHAKLKTQYRLSVLSKNQEILHSAEFQADQILGSQKQAHLQIPEQITSREEDLTVVLDVFRTGSRLDKDVHFQAQLQRSFVNMDDVKDSRKIHSVNLEGLAAQMRLVFVDDLVSSPKIQTEYHLIVRRHGGFLGLEKKVLMEARFTADRLKAGKFSQSLLSLGARSKDLENHAGTDQTLYVELTATRKLVKTNATVSTIKKSVTVKTEASIGF